MTQRRRSRFGVHGTLLLIVAATLGLFSPLQPALRASDLLQPGVDETAALVDKARPAVVKVESGQSGQDGLVSAGSGFFIDGEGTVLTSSTVVGDGGAVRVTVNGLTLDAKILGNDPRSGLAMLRVNSPDSPFLNLGHSTDLKTGYSVLTLGYPMNLPASPSQGLISGFDVRYQARFFSTTHIHADLPISPGQVGGPLLNMRGEVVGLVVPSPDDGQSIYALPVEAVEKIMADFEQYGRAKHGWVGVDVVEVPDVDRDGRTVRVKQAVPGTPASRSGIEPGDTVLRIDAREVYRPADVLDASFFSKVGATMTVVVRRNEKILNYNFAVIERPQVPSATTPVTLSAEGKPGQPVLVNHAIEK